MCSWNKRRPCAVVGRDRRGSMRTAAGWSNPGGGELPLADVWREPRQDDMCDDARRAGACCLQGSKCERRASCCMRVSQGCWTSARRATPTEHARTLGAASSCSPMYGGSRDRTICAMTPGERELAAPRVRIALDTRSAVAAPPSWRLRMTATAHILCAGSAGRTCPKGHVLSAGRGLLMPATPNQPPRHTRRPCRWRCRRRRRAGRRGRCGG